MRKLILTVVFAIACVTIACTSTGADKSHSAPVDAVYAVADTALTDSAGGTDVHADDEFSRVYTIAMAGDIMMGSTWPDTVLPPNSGRMLFRDVRGVLRNADLAVANLEGTLCDSGMTRKPKTSFNYAFRTPLSFAPRLSEAGFDFLSMANNHVLDFGWAGARSTEDALRREGICFAGLRGHRRFAIIRRGDIRFGICAFGHNSYTLRHQDLRQVKAVLDSLRQVSDIIVVSFHGGAEGIDKEHLPYGKETFLNEDRGSLRDFARFCIDNGADVIYGHGPHVVRCVELYKDRFIAYSLGNFCTPYGIDTRGAAGYAPVIEVLTDSDGRFLEGQIHSFIQKRGLGPRRDTANIVVRRIKALTAADIAVPHLTITNRGEILRIQRQKR